MTKIKVTFMPEPTLVKPQTDEEKFDWSKALGSSPDIEFTIEELAVVVGEWSHSFCHATFHNYWIKKDNFQQTQLMVIDIDGGLSPQRAMDRLRELDLPMPNIIYRTLSDEIDSKFTKVEKLKLTKKFRMIFVLNKPVYDLCEYEFYLKQGMYLIFPEADHVSATQRWLGGQEVIHLDIEPRLDPFNINFICVADLYDSRNITTSQGRKKKFKKKYDELPPIILHDGWLGDDDVSKNANSYSILKEVGKNETTNIRNFNWEEARAEFTLLDDFLSGRRKIGNPKLLGLYSGMRRIEGGIKLWKKSIKNNPFIDNRHLAIADWFNSVIARGKNPWEQLISDYAPDDPAANQFERLTDIHFKRGKKAIKLKDIPEIPLKEAQMKMQSFIKKFLDSKDKDIWVCKAATAIGKTQSILENLREGCLLCVPTHKLAQELAERAKKMVIEILLAPEIPPLPEPIQCELDKYHAAGDHIGAAMFLKRLTKNSNLMHFGLSIKDSIEFEKSLRMYFEELEKCTKSSLPVIITHKRLLFTDFPNHDTVIIDEDFIPMLFEIESFTTKDLRLLINAIQKANYPGQDKDLAVLEGILKDINTNSQLYRHIQTTTKWRSEIFENFQEILDHIYFLGNKLNGQILPFFNCSQFIVDFEDEKDPEGERVVHYLVQHHLPKNKKTLVLSATANEFIYKKVFGKIRWQDLSHIVHIGKRIQFSDLSHSRSTIASKNNAKSLKKVIDFIQVMLVITFMRYRHLFKNPADVYLENCAGYDGYKGQDIAVVGTHHLPKFVYRLMAAALEIEFKASDFKLEQQWVKHNGFKFRIMTFAHEGLRNIQFYYIESALVQACGRNRSLREDATVYLFSNFPLPGFEQYSTKELSGTKPHAHQNGATLSIGFVTGSLAS